MAKRIYVHNVQQNEHGLGKVTQAPERCIEAEGHPPRRGWEREHYFWIRPKDTLDDTITAHNLARRRLMINVKGPRWHFYFGEDYTIDHIDKEELDEMFRVEPDSGHSRNDGHSKGTSDPPYCALWGYAELDLTLWVAQWLSTADFKNLYNGAEKEMERGEAPRFAHDNPITIGGMEGWPVYGRNMTRRKLGSWSGRLSYLYQPAHCGLLTTAQVMDDPGWVAALNEVMRHQGALGKRTLKDLMDGRKGNGGDPDDPNDPRDRIDLSSQRMNRLPSVLEGPAMRPASVEMTPVVGDTSLLPPVRDLEIDRGASALTLPSSRLVSPVPVHTTTRKDGNRE